MNTQMNLSKVNRTPWRRYRAWFLVLLSFPLLAMQALSNQNPVYPEVLTSWTGLEESSTMVDVSFQVVRCQANAAPTMTLHVFNEGGQVSSINFTLTIVDNATGQTFIHVVAPFNIPFADMQKGECGGGTHPNLSFDLPPTFDGSNLTVTIQY